MSYEFLPVGTYNSQLITQKFAYPKNNFYLYTLKMKEP